MNKFCTGCGNALVAGGRFCENCGLPTQREPAPTPSRNAIASFSAQVLGLFSKRKWRTISMEVASQHPLYGFGGWVLVIFILDVLVLLAIWSGMLLAPQEVSSAYGGSMAAALLSCLLGSALILPYLVLAPMKSAWMPPLTIICAWAGVVLALPMNLYYLGTGAAMGGALSGTFWALITTLYIVRSRRVNVTYLQRIPADV